MIFVEKESAKQILRKQEIYLVKKYMTDAIQRTSVAAGQMMLLKQKRFSYQNKIAYNNTIHPTLQLLPLLPLE